LTATSFRHIYFEDLDSTNAEARRQADSGEAGPLWISADSQNAGRGRRGRDWVSNPGNLYASLLIGFRVSLTTASQLSFVAALAIYDAVAALLPANSPLEVKWPNDILLADEKLAGILIETIPNEDKALTLLAIGCGVNLSNAPAQTAYGATWLNAHTSQRVTPDIFLNSLNKNMKSWLDIWQNGQGFDLIIKAWHQRTSLIGKTISLTSVNKTTTGTFLCLASDGALVMQLADGRQKHFHAGDVSLRIKES